MHISIETPVFKGRRLRRCIDSVLSQSSPDWRFALLWDGGDEESRGILEELNRRRHPNVTIHFRENQGIARARRYLTEHSEGDFILPLDDDDALPFNAVERFLAVAHEKPWAAVIRARRTIIDDDGTVLDTPPWFPFERRHYERGMVTDIFNHSQPYLIRRSAYDRTTGWEGFEDFGYAGEDCDIYLKLEEAGSIELLDEMLYYYRVHNQRASLALTDQAAFEMWRRLADKTVARIGLPLRRTNDQQPFHYEPLPRSVPDTAALDFIVVASEGDTRTPPDRILGSLQGTGVSRDQVQIIGPGASRLNESFRRTTRALLCIVDATVDVNPEGLKTLLHLMADWELDVAAPMLVDKDTPGGEGNPGQDDRSTLSLGPSEKLVVMRREVVTAVGGMDEGYEHGRAAMIDLYLKARQRDFRCKQFGSVRFVAARRPLPALGPDLDRLRRKWAGYPDLLPGGEPTDVSARSG